MAVQAKKRLRKENSRFFITKIRGRCPLRLDFYPHEWESFYQKCGFDEEELKIIELKRRYNKNWTNHRYAKEVNLPLRTFERRLKSISRKIINFI